MARATRWCPPRTPSTSIDDSSTASSSSIPTPGTAGCSSSTRTSSSGLSRFSLRAPGPDHEGLLSQQVQASDAGRRSRGAGGRRTRRARRDPRGRREHARREDPRWRVQAVPPLQDAIPPRTRPRRRRRPGRIGRDALHRGRRGLRATARRPHRHLCRANLQPGQKVLVHAGSGGVGTYAIQLAKHLGATVATTAGTSNVDWVRELGADIVIDYRTQDFETAAHDYDVVLDSQGGDTLAKSLRILKPGGTGIGIAGPP